MSKTYPIPTFDLSWHTWKMMPEPEGPLRLEAPAGLEDAGVFPIWFDGERLRADRFVPASAWQAESDDGYRMQTFTEGAHYEPGAAVPPETVPPAILEWIRSAWAAYCKAWAEAAARDKEFRQKLEAEEAARLANSDSRDVTICGKTVPLWRWREGEPCACAPTEADRALMESLGLAAEQQARGWFVCDPEYMAGYPE